MKVSKKFIEDFRKVCNHYDCPPEEIEIMKECARNDYENARICFADIAQRIDEKVDLDSVPVEPKRLKQVVV